jgi:hypothetical protein
MPAEKQLPDHNDIKFLLDRPSYLPGQRVQAQVQLNLKNPAKIKSLDVLYQAVEAVHIRAGKATYKDSRDIVNTALRLSAGANFPAGSTTFPFTFDIPPYAIPSYRGNNAEVLWKLSAKADISWGRGLNQEYLMAILNIIPSPPMAVAVENPESEPKIRVELASNVYQPGETIQGKLILRQPGKMRALRLQLSVNEYASGKGTAMGLTHSNLTVPIPMGTPLECSRDRLITAREVPFQIQLPADAACSYKGSCSAISWVISATVDIPHAKDINFDVPFAVGLRMAQPIVAQPTESPSPTPEALAPIPAQIVRPSSETGGDEQERRILEILSDGSPRDIVNMSSKLQEKTGSYMDVNQLKSHCENLVQQGRLERVGQGEYFAQYRLRTVAPAQSANA